MGQYRERPIVVGQGPQQADKHMAKASGRTDTIDCILVQDRFTDPDLGQIQPRHGQPRSPRQFIKRMKQFGEAVAAEPHQPADGGVFLMGDQIGPNVLENDVLRPIQFFRTGREQRTQVRRFVLQHRFEGWNIHARPHDHARPVIRPETVRDEGLYRPEDQSMHESRP